MDQLIPALKFPTTLIIVDDNPEFLNNIELILGGDYRYKSFSSAKEALNFIKQQEAVWQTLIKKYLTINVEDADMSTSKANLDIASIRTLIYDADRFAMSAIVITDFAMPDMNGLEMSEHLKNRLIKMIMLTGEAGYELAVSGFNKELIDQFVLKSKTNFFDEIKHDATHLENKIFGEISKNLLATISGDLKTSIFSDPVFIEFFNELLKKHAIVEYYLLDLSGSYLLLDAEGQVFWLLVKNDNDMAVLYEVAIEESTDKALIDAIKEKKKLVFLTDPDKQFLEPKSWCLEDATTLKGRNTYYYSVVKGTNDYYNLNTHKIASYFDFLKN